MLRNIDNITAIYSSFVYPGVPGLIYAFLLFFAVFIYTCVKLSKEKKRRMELEAYLEGMEEALGEFRKIRHQYNNIFQSIICYIENEEWLSIKNLKNEILQKTSEGNKNNALQLIKIKNNKLRNSFSEIIGICEKNKINFSIAVSGEINSVNMDETALCRLIGILFDFILEKAIISRKKEIIIETGLDGKGFLLIFKSTFSSGSDVFRINTGSAAVNRILKRNKNVIFNNYIEHDYFRQEIMILPR